MIIEQHDDGKKGEFIALSTGEIAGKMTYTWAGPQKLIIDHTEVDEKFKGQGIGKHLLAAIVNYCRTKSVKIIPLCPFAKASFEKDQTIQDVLF